MRSWRLRREGVLHGFQATDKAARAHCRGGCRGGDSSPRGQEGRGAAAVPTTRHLPTTSRTRRLPSQQDQAQYAPPPADPADEIEHLAQLHASGALSDEEFTAAKAKILGT